MKILFPLSCMLLLLACNKNSNELKPIKPDPVEYNIKATLCGDDYLNCLVQVGKSSSLDTSNIKIEFLNNLLLDKKEKVEAFLWFQTGQSYDPDSVKVMKQLLDTSTIKNISSLFENKNMAFVITNLDPSQKCTSFSLGHYYLSGEYKSYNYKDTIRGGCKGIMAADGIFSIWLNDSKTRGQYISGKLIESTSSFCADCKLKKYGSSENFTIKLIKNSLGSDFDTTANFVMFNFCSTTSNGAGDTLSITLNK